MLAQIPTPSWSLPWFPEEKLIAHALFFYIKLICISYLFYKVKKLPEAKNYVLFIFMSATIPRCLKFMNYFTKYYLPK